VTKPSEEEGRILRDTILDCKTQGYGDGQVVFLISQIGDDLGAEEFLKNLKEPVEMQDMVYCSGDKLDDLKERAKNNDEQYAALVNIDPIVTFLACISPLTPFTVNRAILSRPRAEISVVPDRWLELNLEMIFLLARMAW
jgi:hypothetical protein